MTTSKESTPSELEADVATGGIDAMEALRQVAASLHSAAKVLDMILEEVERATKA